MPPIYRTLYDEWAEMSRCFHELALAVKPKPGCHPSSDRQIGSGLGILHTVDVGGDASALLALLALVRRWEEAASAHCTARDYS